MPPSTDATTLLPATAADEPTLGVFMRQLREDDPDEGPYDEALCRPAMAALLADATLGRVWLIQWGGETAGYVVLTLSYSVELGGRYAFIDELFVDRPFRGRGIGGAVLRLVADEARDLGVMALSLEVTRSNETARQLYARNGFVARGHELMTRRLHVGVRTTDRMSEQRASNVTWHAGNVTRADRERVLGQRGVTVWMTGLSASGKSTIAVILERMLLDRGRLAYRLDGDNVRHGLNKNLAFSADDRAENIRRIGEVAKLFTDAGVIVIASFISPYRRDRDAVRALLNPGDFVEVYVKASLEAAERRDPKGLYKKARAGEIKGFTGIDDPYEEPERPEVLIDTENVKPDEAAVQLVAYLEQENYLVV